MPSRTNRNRYKITAKEQETLASKRVGVLGLSVGQAITLTIALDRAAGELRLADFDCIDLPNLNRLRAGPHCIDVPKVVVSPRKFARRRSDRSRKTHRVIAPLGFILSPVRYIMR